MSIQAITRSLAELVEAHEALVNNSREKTAVLKEGSAEKLQTVLVKERQIIQAVENAEANRQKATAAWTAEHAPHLENATITDILELAEEDRQQELADVTAALTNKITELKQQEQLNRSLIDQSMQFVQLSLQTLQPSIQNLNYGKQKQEGTSSSRSLFDSRA
ncbi:flagellar protein FlgN [Lentibacillus sediminis]|uniref:flagellar protein FlgN n=1 Tax=Lentibacillus sediminis TaxID=1940529 RepID=UPI000C1BFD25|nr:flagellar protein FlgN [Lentibacillus sediminis]